MAKKRKRKFFRPMRMLWLGVTAASAITSYLNYKSMRRMATTMQSLSKTLPKVDAAAQRYLEEHPTEIAVEVVDV